MRNDSIAEQNHDVAWAQADFLLIVCQRGKNPQRKPAGMGQLCYLASGGSQPQRGVVARA